MTVSALPAVRRVVIVGSNRIPFARSNTAYSRASNQDMLTFTLQGLIDQYDLHGLRLGEVAAGAVIKHSCDNILRPDLTAEQLAALKPVFDRDAGTLTAGNSTPLTDGASVMLLASEEWAAARNLPVLAYLTLSATAAVDFFDKKEGLLIAPAYAVPRLFERAGRLRFLRDP
ncbi:MAG: 3-ketoacyl-CoA thiolase (EC @ Acetyl-CoA acetyltransferase (EC, FadA2 [uncultured Caballeronia sp.]|nr:MAG: 3-ketoacyl-CoA thiolase (EC @ Acetyl-CoA acetyltransferase (EC, FadA2 [uncultured Caballeronia sp.]